MSVELQDLIDRATADLTEAEAALAAAEGRVAELQTIRDGLKYALQRYGQAEVAEAGKPKADRGEAPAAAVVSTEKPLTGSYGDMALAVLREAGRPLSTAEVREAINARGQNLNREQVRGAVHYLVRRDRISRVGPGLWILPDASKSATSFGPASSAAGPNGAGENSAPVQPMFSPERT